MNRQPHEWIDPRRLHTLMLAEHLGGPAVMMARHLGADEHGAALAADYERRAAAILDLLDQFGVYRPRPVPVPEPGRLTSCDPDPLPGVRIVVRWDAWVYTYLLDPTLFAERFARHSCIDLMHAKLAARRREDPREP